MSVLYKLQLMFNMGLNYYFTRPVTGTITDSDSESGPDTAPDIGSGVNTPTAD